MKSRMEPKVGSWTIETESDVRLYIQDVSNGRVWFSYTPTSPIAVSATLHDFPIYYKGVDHAEV